MHTLHTSGACLFSPSLSSPPVPLSLSYILPFPSRSLRNRPLKSSYRVWRNAVSSPSRVWRGVAAEIEFGAKDGTGQEVGKRDTKAKEP